MWQLESIATPARAKAYRDTLYIVIAMFELIR
jgi:hypothetical protein